MRAAARAAATDKLWSDGRFGRAERDRPHAFIRADP
jgi:hypothetical protein